MDQKLRVLIVEDSEDDTLLLIRQLRSGGYNPVFTRIETKDEMQAALDHSKWDIILADYNLPSFGGVQALEMYQEKGLEIPFIVVSGAIGEETAVNMMKAGAHDYIMKDNLVRLAPAVRREIKEARIRYERNQALVALKESEEKYRSIFSNDYFALCVLNIDTFHFSDVNEGFANLYGYPREAFLSGMTLRQLLANPNEQAELAARQHERSIFIPMQRHKKKDGTIFPAQIMAGPLVIKGRHFVTAMVQDITSRVKTEEKLRYLSTHDGLTRLFNRNFFETEVERLEKGRLFPISIIVADVDGLKTVNDRFGHAAGDLLLKNTADVLLSSFRAEDVVARIGGDEFAVLLPDMDEESANLAYNRVRKSLADYNLTHPDFPLELSMGVTTGGQNDHIKDLLRMADDRMYQQKMLNKREREEPHSILEKSPLNISTKELRNHNE